MAGALLTALVVTLTSCTSDDGDGASPPADIPASRTCAQPCAAADLATASPGSYRNTASRISWPSMIMRTSRCNVQALTTTMAPLLG